MKTKILSRIYILVTAISLLMCAVLLFTVYNDQRSAFHIPPQIEKAASRSDKTVVTEEYINGGLKSILPEQFPVKDIATVIENGQIKISASASKKDIKNWIGSSGIDLSLKQRIMLGMLPGEISVELGFEIDADGAQIALHNPSVAINNSYINMPQYAERLTSALSDGINKLLQSSGISYSRVIVEDGYIELAE